MVYFKVQFLEFVGGTLENPVSSIRVTDLRVTDRIRGFPNMMFDVCWASLNDTVGPVFFNKYINLCRT
jgi:hypothetical protein